MSEEVVFGFDNFQKFKKAYEKAVSQGEKVFVFDGREYLTNYAKYLIEFLKQRFEN